MTLETGALIAVLLGVAALFWHERRERLRLRARLEDATTNLERLQHTFAHFAPGPLVDRIITGGVENIGEKREVTALFADLVGYTARRANGPFRTGRAAERLLRTDERRHRGPPWTR